MGSSRFPGKPLAALHGLPLIEHVFRRAAMCNTLDEVYVATCDEEIRAAVEAFGGTTILTSAAHERASDRVAEAAQHFHAGIIVMIQGDEPMITPDMIEAAVSPLRQDASTSCVNLVGPIITLEEYLDPNTIKVVSDIYGNALYFSRAPIPSIDFNQADSSVFKQVCVVGFRSDSLREYARLQPTPLEQAESIDMLRLIEHGKPIRLISTETRTHAVDIPADLELVKQLMRSDPFLVSYCPSPIHLETWQ
jgi:3-deoxy-manno-octulosonate cytidylyltransferase (CMP-KDO synthetase)